jgi:[ribosomal protein S18]-alanine N-acetyltransferase
MTTVRRVRSSDGDFIVALSEQVFSEYSLQAGQRAIPLTQGRGVLTLVAEWRNQRAGFAVLRSDARGTGHVDAIAVTELARGHGVGKRLLAEVEAEALERGLRRLELVTADSNLAALMLFHRAGFTTVERLLRHYPRGQDALRLSKRLGML